MSKTIIRECDWCKQPIYRRKFYKPVRGYTLGKFNPDGTEHIDDFSRQLNSNSGMADSL